MPNINTLCLLVRTSFSIVIDYVTVAERTQIETGV